MMKADNAKMKGVWYARINDGPWEEAHNVITVEGATKMLDVMFNDGVSKVNTWYIGLYTGAVTPLDSWTNEGPPTINARVTESAAYTSATRPAWDEGAAAAGSITDATVASFTFNEAATILGGFLSSASSKTGAGDVAGSVLFSCVNFASSKVMAANDVLQVSYTVTAADGS